MKAQPVTLTRESQKQPKRPVRENDGACVTDSVQSEFAHFRGIVAPISFSKIRILAPAFTRPGLRIPIQRKLAIGAVNDPLEQEADRVADEVMAGSGTKLAWSLSQIMVDGPAKATTVPANDPLESEASLMANCIMGGQPAPALVSGASPGLRRKCACEASDKPCEACQEGRKNNLLRIAARAVTPTEVPPVVEQVLHSPGQPLDAATRAFMEPRFGHDFSQVRVHTDEHAAESVRAVDALAYTVGRHIAFGSGWYAPRSLVGRQLLAHELTHVVQQTGSDAHGVLEIGSQNDLHEREANKNSKQVDIAGIEGHFKTTPLAAPGRSRVQRAFLEGAIGAGLGLLGGALIGGLVGGPVGAVIGGLIGLGVGALVGALLGKGKPEGDKIQMVSGRYVGNVEGNVNNLREEVLFAMDRLRVIGSLQDADYNVEYAAISALPLNSSVPKGSIPKTIAAIRRLSDASLSPPVARTVLDLPLTAGVGRGQTNNRADIAAIQDALHVDWNLSDPDYTTERAALGGLASPRVPEGLIPKTIEGISKMKSAFVAGAIRRDLFVGTKAVTETQHANIEHVLNPTTILVPPAPPPAGGPAPPPAVVNPPPMTGTGPGGAFETEMLHMLKSNVGGWAADFRKLKGEPGQPAFPTASANNVARSAQGEVERYYSPYIRVASRGIADVYHPGAYSLVSKLGDESTRPLSDDDRRGWLEYFMSLRPPNCRSVPCGQTILDAHNYVGSRDRAEFDRVRDLYLSEPANVTDLNDTIHSWPAEAGTGTVFIQPYQRIANAAEGRKQRWRLFTTLIHEMMHIVMHPNFAAAADRIGGTARKILVEGFAEVFRTELWSGTGQLRARLANSEMAPVREQVEGAQYPYDASVVEDSGYYDQLADANSIDGEVGRQNSKAAFFLGHVELLGLGAGTRTETGALGGVAMYEPTDSPDAQVIVAAAGDDYAKLQARSGASPGMLVDDATGVQLPIGAPIAPGTRVRIPGIRWVRAIVSDTLGSVAQQNHVPVSVLAQANGLPAGSPPATPLAVGSRILIPIHRNLP